MPFDLTSFEKPDRPPEYQIVEDLIYLKYRSTPRHLQRALGPSEIGEPCIRRLAYNIMHHPEVNESDPLPSIIGTAAHKWMHEACLEFNQAAGEIIWIPECTVNVDGCLSGHADALHVPTMTVYDWKFPGQSRMTKYAKDGPSAQYEIQAHLYCKGFRNVGLPVERVAIVFLPRGGFLKDAYIWVAPYAAEVADSALARYHGITEVCIAANVDKQHDLYTRFPRIAGHDCQFCPWFKPTSTDMGTTCPGYAL